MGSDTGRYLNGNKATWRGWVWNRIAERIRDKRNANVLYLIGDSDEDRKKAISKGFRNENLIGVDVRQSSVDAVREAGGIAICADINEVISEWPENRSVDAVVLDYCSGLQENTALTVPLIASRKAFIPSVVVINLQRGRDNVTGAISSLVKCDDSAAMADHLRRQYGKHRGEMLLSSLFSGIAYEQSKTTGEDPRELFFSVANAFNPQFYSCSPNKVVMDTSVFTVPWHMFRITRSVSFSQTKRKISALLAVQTIRSR